MNIIDDFPLLKEYNNLIYFDNAATSQKPYSVIENIQDFYVHYNAPIKRGLYQLAEEATQKFEQARETIAHFIHAQSDETIFTSGATEGINFIASTWGQKHLAPGDEIVLTELEHHSNLVPWQECAKRTGAVIKFIPTNQDGTLNLDMLLSIITPKTKLVSFLDVSNALGTHVPVAALVQRARQVGARIFIDACQSVPHQKINVKKYDCDFLVFSGHKMLGPTGIGILYIKKDIQPEVPPYQYGGGMIFHGGYSQTEYLKAPQCYQAGTPPVAQAIGLAAAVDYLNNIDFNWLRAHEAALCTRAIEGLQEIPGIQVLGPIEHLKQTGHLVSFIHSTHHPHDIAAYLDTYKICVRAGHFCAQPLADKLGITGSVRLSFYLYNTLQEVDSCIDALKKMKF